MHIKIIKYLYNSKLLCEAGALKYLLVVMLRWFRFFNEKLREIMYAKSIENASLMCSLQLKYAFDYALQRKTFQESLRIRKELLKRILDEQRQAKIVNLDALKVAIELGEYDLFSNWLASKNTNNIQNIILNELVAYVQLITGNKTKWNEWVLENALDVDVRAMNLMKHKAVLFYGPAPGSIDLGSCEADFDFIAVINYTNRTKIHEHYGKKKLISYYNGQRLKEEIDHILIAAEKLQMIAPKAGCLHYFDKLAEERKHLYLRAMRKPENVMYTNAEPNNFQNGIYDLLFMCPKVIFITGFNFWCSESPWLPEYKPRDYMHYNNISKSIRAQEPFANFMFVKNLFKMGLINLANDVSEIANLDIEAYAKRLDCLYPIQD